MSRELSNKPLVEAIAEVRWKLQGAPSGPQIDPHYKLLLGRLFDRMLKDYPEHEQLPTANVPDELVGHVVQHRFRVGANVWPLVQVGPGILTINSTGGYKWEDFRPRILSAIKKLYEAHPKVEELTITNLVLRYIDAVEFDPSANDVFLFLREKLKLDISMPGSLFENTGVEEKPNSFTWQGSFKVQDPNGRINLRFATGQKNNAPALIWETTIESAGDDLPEMPEGYERWADAGHSVTSDWFFKMIEGDLQRRFSVE